SIFGIDDFENSFCRKQVDIDRAWVSSFGAHRVTYILFRSMPDVDVTIRRARGLEDYLACVQLQKDVWKYTEAEDLAAQPMLMISDRFGGSVLVALDSTGRHIGFAFAMPGWQTNKRLFWWSHMTAVLPEYRNREIGLALKLRQRAEALASGIDLI